MAGILNDAASIAAIEITKVSSFVSYLERNAPGAGNVAEYTKNLTEGIKQQIESTGASPLIGAFEQAKEVIPNLAMQGYAEAQGFTEFLVSKAPQVFSGGAGSAGLGILDSIRGIAPEAFDTASQVGGKAAQLVAEGGVEVFNQIKDLGGVLPFLQLVHPGVLVAIAPSVAIDFETVSAAKNVGSDAVSGAKEVGTAAAPVAKEAASAVAEGGKELMNSAAPAAAVVGSGLSEAMNAMGGVAATAASAIGSAFSNIDSEVVSEGANVALNVIGSAAAVFPFLLPLQIALRDIGNAVQQATYNKEAAELLKVRCQDCAKLIVEMSPKIAKIAGSDEERKEMVAPFVAAIDEASEFLKKFSSRNFLMHMITWKREGRSLQFIDKKITDTLQNLSMRVNGYQVDVQVNTNEKVEQIFNMLNTLDLSKIQEPKDIQPEKLIEIIKAAGAESTEEIKQQMSFIGVQMEEVTKAINNLNENIANVSQTITVLSDQLSQHTKDNEAIKDALLGQKENNDFMKDFLVQSMATMNMDNNLTLTEIKNLILQGGGSNQHQEVYCDTNKAMYLSTKAMDLKEKAQHITLIHPHGINFHSYQSINGENGANGTSGYSAPKARSGAPGNAMYSNMDGTDGEDGEDGHDGEHAEDGEHGRDAGNFEVMILFVKENKQAGTRTYRIEHSGPYGKSEEDVDIPIVNSIILIDGAGGKGGKGGDGGRGGNGGEGGNGGAGAAGSPQHHDGGDGGNGGNGGNGGEGGDPGNGGNGGHGASIIVRTNDPSVLALIEVDVSGGKGGLAGLVGVPGEGGSGGAPGEAGPGAIFSEDLNDGRGPQQRTGMRGRRGKQGKKGKKGKTKQAKKSNAGTDGKCGKVSFCIYDDKGFKESNGTPYRVMIHRKDVPKMTPCPLTFGTLSNDRFTDPFVYGQMLQVGPVLPINIGSLYSPAVQMLGRLIIQQGNKVMNKISALKFPPIPGEKQTRYGELAKNLEQLLKVNLPSVKELGLVIDTETWPWKKQFDKLPRLQALFTFIFSFNGIIQKASVVDKDHICRYDFPLNVEVPLEIISYHYGANPDLCQEMMKKGIEERRKKYTGSPRHAGSKAAVVPPEVDRELLQGGDAIRTPRSIVWHPDQMSFKISSYLYNRLQNTDFTKTSMARVVVSAAGYQCYVKIKNVSNGHVSSATNDIFTELPVNPATEGYQRSSLISTIPNLEKGKAKELTFELSIPTKQTKPNSTEMIEVPIGSTILLREELIYDEMIAEVTPFQSVRIAPAWPPANQVIPDVILFTDTSYDRHDFQIISKFFTTLNLSVAYFDVEHFCTINDSIQYSLPQPPNTNVWKMSDWEAYAGKSAIWWLPLTKDLASLAHHQDFITHIQKSGGFATGEVSLTTNPFQVPQELNNFLTKEMRNVIAYPDNFSIHALKEMNNNFSISADRITGHYSLLQAIVATFLTMKFEKKLQYLFDQQNKSTLNIIVSQEIQLSDYRVEVEVGCCGFGAKKSKIHPCNRSPLTLRDVLLVAIRTEIMMDLGAFVVTNNPNYCFGINSVLSFCEQNRISSYRNNGKQTPKSIAMFCRDLAAAVTTSNVLGPDKFQSSATNRIFSNVQTKLQLLVSTCHSIAFDHQLDYEGFSERISDLDIVNGFSSRVKGVNSPRDPINIGKGMRLHITGKFN